MHFQITHKIMHSLDMQTPKSSKPRPVKPRGKRTGKKAKRRAKATLQTLRCKEEERVSAQIRRAKEDALHYSGPKDAEQKRNAEQKRRKGKKAKRRAKATLQTLRCKEEERVSAQIRRAKEDALHYSGPKDA